MGGRWGGKEEKLEKNKQRKKKEKLEAKKKKEKIRPS